MRVPSSRQQLELHLQVAAFLSRALPSAPLPVAHEEPAEAVRDCVEEELQCGGAAGGGEVTFTVAKTADGKEYAVNATAIVAG